MALTLHESIWQITVGATVLLDFEDFMEGIMEIDGQPEVDATGFVGGGGRTFARENIFHGFSWTKWHVFDTAQQAAAYQLNHTKALKELAGLDAVIKVALHAGSMTLNKATVVAFPSGIYERFARFNYTLHGGALSGEITVADLLGFEDGSVVGTEDGSLIGTET